MTKIIYIVHSTSQDNKRSVVSGHHDSALSALGKSQAKKLSETLQKSGLDFGTIYSSPLSRASSTAKILFDEEAIHFDRRLMEIHYGEHTHFPTSDIQAMCHQYIARPFPGGESYQDVEKRMRAFLSEHKNKELLTIVAHQAPQLALEVLCNHSTWEMALSNDWRRVKQWQPFWVYHYQK